MQYTIPHSGERQQLWVTDELGNRLMPLESIFGTLRLGGMGLGRYVTNDENELVKMYVETLSGATDSGCQISAENAAVIIEQLACFVVSKSLSMPADVINAKGYSLQEKVRAVCNHT